MNEFKYAVINHNNWVIPVVVNSDCVELKFGRKTIFGNLLIMLTGISYFIAILFMSKVIPNESTLSWGLVILFGLAMAIVSNKNSGMLVLSIIIFIFVGGYIAYTLSSLLLLGFLFLIILGHITGYTVEYLWGDRLLVRFFKSQYEIYYRNKILVSGGLSQSDFKMRWYKDPEGGIYCYYDVIFLPLEIGVDEYSFVGKIMTIGGEPPSLDEKCKRKLSDLLQFLEVPYDPEQWLGINSNNFLRQI